MNVPARQLEELAAISPGRVLFVAAVGSRAYGTAGDGSDFDMYGCYAAPARAVLGLGRVTDVVNVPGADVTCHELARFVHLGLRANPRVLEALWSPVVYHTTSAGDRLRQLRRSMLSTAAVRGTFGGFVASQLKKVMSRSSDDPRRVKKQYHLFRVLRQGTELLRTGELPVALSVDEDRRLRELATVDLTVDTTVVDVALRELRTMQSCLPESPDVGRLEEFVVRYRTRQALGLR